MESDGKTYDVFISYRRDKGAFIARNLQQALEKLGLRVFFDMEELTDGKFNEKLYDAIEHSKNVLFLMTEGALDRCVNESDWVRNELEHVMDRGVNLVPVAPTGTRISFPEGLPAKLEPMKVLEVSELNLEKLFKESVAKIATRFKDVVIAGDNERKEAEEAFLSQARRFKGNDGVIDAEEKRQLEQTAKDLGISPRRRIALIEQVEQEFVPAAAAGPDLMPPTSEVVPSYDVFVSYRRDGGAADARLMYERLTKDGYSVSFDMDTLGNGNFNEELLRRIAECRNFIVLLSKGCFDRTLNGCRREDDWMRIELATALYNRKNVVTVMLPGFEFPKKLPPDIDAIRSVNGPKYDLYYLDSFYEKLEKQFLRKDEPDGEKRREDEARNDRNDNILSVETAGNEHDTSMDDIFGDDSAYWREEAEAAYRSVSRVIPYAELKRLDDAWGTAEANFHGGDHKIATRSYMDVVAAASKVKGSSSPFVTRMVGDGIDTHSADWFESALKKAQEGDRDYQYGVGTLYAEGLGVEKDSSAAFRWFERAAAQGHVKALAAVGASYSSGEGVEIDYKAARRFLAKAERKNDAQAFERIGFLYENGFGVRRNYAIAVDKYKKAAAGGNSNAMVALGRMLEEGTGIEADLDKAIAWYRLALANGNAVAQRKMAGFLLSGKGMEKNEAEAVKLARLAANQGDADAIALLGRAYENGTGVEANPATAEELYRKAVEGGSALGKLYLSELEAEAQYRNGVKCLEGREVKQDFAAALQWFEKSAAQSNAAAMEQLGFMHERGLGCGVDTALARQWYEKAADKGNAAAMVGLGKMYFLGYDGIEKDYGKARELFKKAASEWRTTSQENQWKVLYAFFYLGRIYTEGLGVEKDLTLGQRCLLFGAGNGNVACARAMGVNYEKGTNGFAKSEDRAKSWYAKCASLLKNGKFSFADDIAMRVFGLLCQYGDGIEQDIEKSREWFLRAAALGNVQCLKSMGKAYLKGLGVPKDVSRAVSFYEAAGNRGDYDAQKEIGWLYYQGKEVARDLDKARNWFEKAAALGSGYAMEKLSRIFRDGDGVEKDDEASMKWLERAVGKGDPFAMAELGHCHEFGERGKEKDVPKALELYKKAAEKKSIRARYEYGRCLLRGIGTDVNVEEAFKVLSKAVVSGKDAMNYYQKATQLLVEMYFNGDFKSNVERFSAIDESASNDALARLGQRLEAGDGVQKDIDKALACLTVAAAHGDKSAQNRLGWMYYKGEHIERNSKLAFEWTMKAVQNGNPHGMETLFRMYRDGDGVEQSDAEALKWLETASRNPDAQGAAISELGECYEYGWLGLNKDASKAFEFYYRASQKIKCPGKYNRGRCHLYGIGTPVDVPRAIEWLSKAAEKEDGDDHKYDLLAMALLVKVYSEGTLVEKDDAKAAEWQSKLDELKKKRQEEIPGFVSPV